jgi:hypothetical protein
MPDHAGAPAAGSVGYAVRAGQPTPMPFNADRGFLSNPCLRLLGTEGGLGGIGVRVLLGVKVIATEGL